MREISFNPNDTVFAVENFAIAAVAKPVVGELFEQFVVWAETDPVEVQKINTLRQRAAVTQALLTVLDEFWIETKQYPVERDRSNKLFDLIQKTPKEISAIIDDEFAKRERRPSLEQAAAGRWSVNTGTGFADTNPAVPNYGTIFGKYYNEPDLMQGVLLLQFAARSINLFRDPSVNYTTVRTDRDAVGSPLRIGGDALNELVKLRAEDKDHLDEPRKFPQREFAKYHEIAILLLKEADKKLGTKYPQKSSDLCARLANAVKSVSGVGFGNAPLQQPTL